ncbi:MAG: DUF29 domain-containing protein [Pseudomonadota bacterium]
MNHHSRLTQLTAFDADYHQWSVEQARLLREGKLDQLDRKHLAEEIEALGRSEKNEIKSRLIVLLVHLLKWKFQPERRGRSWKLTLKTQRNDLAEVIADNPSLKSFPKSVLLSCYDRALLEAEKETGLQLETFPDVCPFTIEQIVDETFFPE